MVTNAFDVNFDYAFKEKLIAASLEEKESILREKENGKNALLNTFGFTNPSINEVKLTPRFKGYDYLIDTSQLLPHQTAHILSSTDSFA